MLFLLLMLKWLLLLYTPDEIREKIVGGKVMT